MTKTWKEANCFRSLVPVFVFGALVVLGGSLAYAQSEIDPDHFESPNVEPLEKGKTNPDGTTQTTHYDGEFVLPYSLLCNGNVIRSGRYTVSLHFAGDVAKATLNREGHTVEIEGVARKQDRELSSNAIILQLQGVKRTLFAIQASGWLFQPKGLNENSVVSKAGRFDRLPLTGAKQVAR